MGLLTRSWYGIKEYNPHRIVPVFATGRSTSRRGSLGVGIGSGSRNNQEVRFAISLIPLLP